jgi:hypothetical protein
MLWLAPALAILPSLLIATLELIATKTQQNDYEMHETAGARKFEEILDGSLACRAHDKARAVS